MPSVRIENVVLVALIVFVPRAEAFPDGPQTTSPAVKALQGLRDEGFRSRVDFRKVSNAAARARIAMPNSPIPEYAYGLILLSRVQPERAVTCFKAAIDRDTSYLPAWKALLQTRLTRRQTDDFRKESLKLAELASSQQVTWQNPQDRREAAVWLGRMMGFLSLPHVSLLHAEERSRLEAALISKLGKELKMSYAAGQTELRKDREQLETDLKKEAAQASAIQQKQNLTELSVLNDRGEEIDEKAEILELTTEQWDEWLRESHDAADNQLKDLQKQYDTLSRAAQLISQLIQQTQYSVGRYQTQLGVRGIRGVQADQQAGLIELRRELLQYQQQYQALEQRAAAIVSQGRQIAARQAAVQLRYQQATGKITRESAILDRWKKSVAKETDKIGKQDFQTLETKLKRRLYQVPSYFKLDAEEELNRLIAEVDKDFDANQ